MLEIYLPTKKLHGSKRLAYTTVPSFGPENSQRQNNDLSKQAAELLESYDEHKIEKVEHKTTDGIEHNNIEDTSAISEDDGRKIYESKVKNIYFGIINKGDNNENN